MGNRQRGQIRRKESAVITVLLILVLCGFNYSSAQAYSGVVSVDIIEATAGEQVEVPVRLQDNDEPISAITIPLWKSSSMISLDSVSFAGSIVPGNFVSWLQPAGAIEDTIKITLVGEWESPTPVITESEGILATLHVTVSPSAQPGFITIDSFYTVDTFYSDLGGVIEEEQRLLASDASGITVYLPDFNPGGVRVLVPTDIEDDIIAGGLPSDFALGQNYPNPFNPMTTIEYSLPRAGHVTLEIFNVLGQRIATPVDRYTSAGSFAVQFDASPYPSGVYFYRLSHSEGVETRKMTLLK